MKPPLLTHAIEKEFPKLADKVLELMHHDREFARLLDKHNTVDKEITEVEEKEKYLSDKIVHRLKQERLLLKDSLYHIWTH